jgi:hypothetical protein
MKRQGDKKIFKERTVKKIVRWIMACWGVKKKEFWWRVLVESTTSSGIPEHVGQRLTLVHAHVLPEIVVTTEILPTSLDRTLVRCSG